MDRLKKGDSKKSIMYRKILSIRWEIFMVFLLFGCSDNPSKKEIESAIKEIKSGKYITHEDLAKEMGF